MAPESQSVHRSSSVIPSITQGNRAASTPKSTDCVAKSSIYRSDHCSCWLTLSPVLSKVLIAAQGSWSLSVKYGSGVGVGSGVGSGVAVGFRMGSGVAVGTWVGVDNGVGVSVAENVGNGVGNGVGEGKAVSVGRSGVTVFLGDAVGMSPRVGGLVEIGGLVKVGAEVKGTEVLVDGTKVAGTTVSLAEGP
ncbi:MAG TPA: hypothetical protein EYM65_06615 [Dehalococcoidia bacterium]|nr:hypothetical protein [Dehalococcoidia bacterium]